MRADRHKALVAFHNFVNEPKNFPKSDGASYIMRKYGNVDKHDFTDIYTCPVIDVICRAV